MTTLDVDSDQGSEDEFQSFGRFYPPDAKQILRRFEEKGVRFRIDAPDEIRPSPTYLRRLNRIVIWVHQEDRENAAKILLEDWKA